MNGAFGQCQGGVFPTPRDCSTDLDRDCDGRPDNTTDNVCTCAIGAVRECGTHPGLDGNGPCQAGSQRCEGRANNTTSNFGSCIGSVGPAPQDTCASGNDSNCNTATASPTRAAAASTDKRGHAAPTPNSVSVSGEVKPAPTARSVNVREPSSPRPGTALPRKTTIVMVSLTTPSTTSVSAFLARAMDLAAMIPTTHVATGRGNVSPVR